MRRRGRARVDLGLLWMLACASAVPAAGHDGGHGAAETHAGNPPLPRPRDPGYSRRAGAYDVPDLTLVDQRGRSVRLASLLGAEQPLMLNFIFTSCTTICPVSLATFGAVREQLGSEAGGVRFVSISIDPEHDTPARLLEYAHRQGVGDSWHFLTGDSWSVRRVQEAFGAYRGDKASHAPLILLRASPEKPWLRIEGFPSASDLVREYRRLVGE